MGQKLAKRGKMSNEKNKKHLCSAISNQTQKRTENQAILKYHKRLENKKRTEKIRNERVSPKKR